jgi:uncharacterized repeat protein (TIGR03803 family)
MRALPSSFCNCFSRLTFAAMLLFSIQATASKEKILHEFSMLQDGTTPQALVSDSSGNLFGVAQYGGQYNMGAIFEFAPNGSGGWTETVLHSFSGGTDGVTPLQIVLDAAGNIYGATYFGGAGNCSNPGCGIVFKLSRNQGGKGWTETVIYNVQPADGTPSGALVLDNAGNLYWAVSYYNNGVSSSSVSELTPSGANWTNTTLYTFPSVIYIPGLAIDSTGNLYGTLYAFGTSRGSVFELTPASGGTWTEKTLYNFPGGTSGADPIGALLLRGGNLYGTTLDGGDSKCDPSYGGCGVAFELIPGSNGQWTENVLYAFPGLHDNASSEYPNLSAFDSSGTLYGFTKSGGAGVCTSCGSVFTLTPNGNGSWTEKDLYDFTGQSDGDFPTSLVLGTAGQVYGTNTGAAFYPGLASKIFELTPQSGMWAITVLFTFAITDGENPYAGLVFDSAGNFYGTTYFGGTNAVGSVFKMSPLGNAWKETMIYSFGPASTSSYFSANPSSLIVDSKGNLYGTAENGGTSQFGSVFELSPQMGGTWRETDLYSFQTVDAKPMGGVIFDNAGRLYGVTLAGGAHGLGSVFQLAQDSSGTWQLTVIHDFTGYPSDGAHPAAGLIFDSAGNLYGSTERGGSGICTSKSITEGCGTVFELSYVAGAWKETILYAFQGTPGNDGANPMANLIFGASGDLYGTTFNGGLPNFYCYEAIYFDGCGTVFKLSPSNGAWSETVLYEFGRFDGSTPSGGLVMDKSGNLYGMTTYYGSYGGGTLYKLSPAVGGGWTKSVLHSFGSGTDGFYPEGSLILDSVGSLYGVTYGGGIRYNQGTVFEITP